MNKKALVAGIAVAAVVAGGLYFGPGNGGQGFIFRIPQREAVNVETPKINLGSQDLSGKNFQIRNGVGYEGQGRGSATNDDAVAIRKPIDLDAKRDFSINPDAMYQGDGQKRTPEASPNPFGSSDKPSKPVLGSGNRGGSTPVAPVAEEPDYSDSEEEVVNPLEELSTKISRFQTLVWQYESAVRTFAATGCVSPDYVLATQNVMRDLSDDAYYMTERVRFVANGQENMWSRLGQSIATAKDNLENFADVIERVDNACVNKSSAFPEAYYDDVNYGRTLGEVKDLYDAMPANAWQ
ncbi:hypothetical protein KA119_02250 [Candidatus Gracilibacteria bacterium]|nr:hypothetical protein [Candidatus Gracilibacteria bacterium]